MSSQATPCSGSLLTQWLPDGFKPTENEVLIGRGRKILQHAGNQKLQALVKSQARAYAENSDKTHKSYIISDIGKRIKEGSQFGGFVKKDAGSGKWYVVSESCIRSTIAQTFRDTLSPNYRSSKFSKQRRRWSERVTKDGQNSAPVVTMTTVEQVQGNVTKANKPLADTCPSFHPMSLQQAMRNSNLITEPLAVSSSSFPFAVTEQSTSDILQNCLEVMGSDQQNWISYSDDPYEPTPIPEQPLDTPLELEGASKPEWWI